MHGPAGLDPEDAERHQRAEEAQQAPEVVLLADTGYGSNERPCAFCGEITKYGRLAWHTKSGEPRYVPACENAAECHARASDAGGFSRLKGEVH